LYEYLLTNQVITNNEINNINNKLKNGMIDINTVFNYLLNKKKMIKNISIPKTTNNFFENKWYNSSQPPNNSLQSKNL